MPDPSAEPAGPTPEVDGAPAEPDHGAVSAPGASAGGEPRHDELAGFVQAARDGDDRAFARLVDATYVATYTLALRITGDVEDARDVTQEAYLRAYRSLGDFRGDAQFTTWMYRITANCASTSLKRRRRHRHDELVVEGSDIVDLRHDVNPELRADASDLKDRLLGALDRLPPKLRAVVVLRDVYELSHEAIASELGISATAAKVRLHRARHRLRNDVFPDSSESGSTKGAATKAAATKAGATTAAEPPAADTSTDGPAGEGGGQGPRAGHRAV